MVFTGRMRGVTFPDVKRSSLALEPQLELFASKPNRSCFANSWQIIPDSRNGVMSAAARLKTTRDPLNPSSRLATFTGNIISARSRLMSRRFCPTLMSSCELLSSVAPWLTLLELQLRHGAAVTEVRHTIIKRAVICGYRRADIARKLNVSESTVSKVVRSLFELRPIRTTGNFSITAEPKSKRDLVLHHLLRGSLPRRLGEFGSRRGTAIRLLCPIPIRGAA